MLLQVSSSPRTFEDCLWSVAVALKAVSRRTYPENVSVSEEICRIQHESKSPNLPLAWANLTLWKLWRPWRARIVHWRWYLAALIESRWRWNFMVEIANQGHNGIWLLIKLLINYLIPKLGTGARMVLEIYSNRLKKRRILLRGKPPRLVWNVMSDFWYWQGGSWVPRWVDSHPLLKDLECRISRFGWHDFFYPYPLSQRSMSVPMMWPSLL